MKRTFLTLLTLACVATPLYAVPIPASTVHKWAIKEITLCAQGTYADWQAYQTVRVTAQFNGPQSTTLFVNGFWDGKGGLCAATQHAFKVRFTPHIQGTWTFSISNNQGDAGLTVSPAEAGAITVDGPQAPPDGGDAPKGFVRRETLAGSTVASYIWGTGEHVYLWGQTYYQIVNREANNDHTTWQDAVDMSTGYNPTSGSAKYTMNKIRMLVSPWNANGGANTQPYKRNPDTTLNRDQINPAHFRSLEAIVSYLGKRNVVAEIILFRDKGDEVFLGNPTQDCRYLRYATSRLAAYPNVIWSLSNEWENANPNAAYWNDLGAAMRGEPQSTCTGTDFSTPLDPWLLSGGRSRILTIHPAANDPITNTRQFCFEFAGSTWPSSASLQSHKTGSDNTCPASFQGDRRGYESIACNQVTATGSSPCALPPTPLPVANDEYGYIGNAAPPTCSPASPLDLAQTEHRNVIWGIATGGGYGSAGDVRKNGQVYPLQFTNWVDAPEYGDIKRLQSFFTSPIKAIEWWKMRPQTACQANTRVHTLAEPGRQYVTYTATGATFSVDGFVNGQYHRLWFNPRTANANDPSAGIDQGCLNITVNSFTPPGGSPGDWVLLLNKTTSCP